MTKQVNYTHYHAFDSSVLDEGWYDEVNKELYLLLHNGTVVGYAGFSRPSWISFIADPSAGAHWNRWIKNKYVGIDGNVEFISPVPDSKPFVDSSRPSVNVLVRFNGEFLLPFNTKSVDDAIAEVEKIFGGTVKSGSYKILEVTKRFDD